MLPRAATGLTLVVALALVFAPACDRSSAVDSVTDFTMDAGVWLADARAMAGALPRQLGGFVPAEGADPFFTNYSSGPVFGASCAYAESGRQLVVRFESGNIRLRAAAALDAGAEGFRSSVATIHGVPATVRWSEIGRTGEVVFVYARQYLVQMRLVPAHDKQEIVKLAESLDLGPLDGLALDGISR
jgi:hypothetical protein